MGKVIFLMNVSLDGYVETPDHSLDWTIVDDELLAWFNERTRSIEAIVYGRRRGEAVDGEPGWGSQPRPWPLRSAWGSVCPSSSSECQSAWLSFCRVAEAWADVFVDLGLASVSLALVCRGSALDGPGGVGLPIGT